MWLISASGAVSLAGAVVGIVLLGALTDLPAVAVIAVGGVAGSALAALTLGRAADRLDRRLHRMGGLRRARRRGGRRP